MPRTRIAVLTFLLVLVIAAVIAWGVRSWRRLREGIDVVLVSDTVRMIAEQVEELIREEPDPTDRELREAIQLLEDASISNLWYDARGAIVDAWGTPFVIDWKRGSPDSAVTVKSAGPDRFLGTADDIVRTR